MTPEDHMEQLLYYLTLATNKNEDDININPPQQDPATLPSSSITSTSASASLGSTSIVEQLLIQQNFTNVNLTTLNQQQQFVNNSVSTNIVVNGGQPGMANANPIELVSSGNNNSNCGVGYHINTAPTFINMNFNNTYMGVPTQLIINPTKPVDQQVYSPNSTPTSSSSSASHDSAPQMLETVKKKKNKIKKQRKMNREMISTGYNSSSVYNVGSSSSIASSSTDSPTSSASSSNMMQFIHTSNEEMKIKYDSESSLNSTVTPKRKRGRPKKQEPTRPAKLDYQFIQEKGTGDPKSKK